MICKEILLPDDLSLHDSNILETSIYCDNNDTVNAKVIVELSYPKGIYLKFIFKNVIDYFFQWNNNYNFYIVESYKFLKTNKGFYYCSFDPADQFLSISENDGGIIMSEDIELYYSRDCHFVEEIKVQLNGK